MESNMMWNQNMEWVHSIYGPESIVAGYSVTRHYLGLMQHLNK